VTSDQILEQDGSCEGVFRQIASGCLEAIDAELALFLSSPSPSGPHKARVALRRLTTCLDAFAPILRKEPRANFRRHAKQIFRALGAVRDSDVSLALRAEEEGHGARVKANQMLRDKTRAAFRKEKAVTFAARLRTAILPGSPLFRQGEGALAMRQAPLENYAADILDKAWQECLGHGLKISAMKPLARHDFRKDLKTMRYLAEFFADVFPALNAAPFRNDFRLLQNALGQVNDFEVAALTQKRRPMKLPRAEREALDQAEAVWRRISHLSPPWKGGAETSKTALHVLTPPG
jgi:CHAD domain-containing protein